MSNNSQSPRTPLRVPRPLLSLVTCITCFGTSLMVYAAENPFVGRWALTLPNGAAGWMGIEEKGGVVSGDILWSDGSPVPLSSAKVKGDQLVVCRLSKMKQEDAGGTELEVEITETIIGTLDGDCLTLVTSKAKADGKKFDQAELKGFRIKAMPPKPDLTTVKFGEPIAIFNGKDLSGWRLVNPKDDNGWSVKDGILMNRVVKDMHFGNLRTDATYEDFNLKLEVRTMEESNSGVYLRGVYEVQVAESFGKPVDSRHMGALYGRITPSVAAEKPVGDWQTLDITLVDRYLTVVLNGKTIIDNQAALGCTGGALTCDEFKPGPIFLQGDHTNIDYRNIVLRPVVK